MGCAMRDSARAFVEVSLREQDPQATKVTIRKGLFLRSYGHEFDAPTRANILAAIEQAAHLGITRQLLTPFSTRGCWW